jgi:hypothetical protein
MNTQPNNRKSPTAVRLLIGIVVGVICYLVAELLVPKQVESPGEHDLFLANRLGLIYAPTVGVWLAWLQRSWRRALLGAAVGVLIGLAYVWLCSSGDFLAIMVGFPCLLGGILAALVGSNCSPWLGKLGARLGKGLLAGFVLGLVYMIALNLVGAMTMPQFQWGVDFTPAYVIMMWRSGPVALGLASGLFFLLMHWAVGLTRVRLLVFEDANVPQAEPEPDKSTQLDSDRN